MKKTKLFAIVSIIICTLFAVLASACAHALDVPTGWTIDENLVLSWAGVEDARNYLIEIKNCETGETEEETSRKKSISLEELDVGNYEIKIKAVAGERSGNADSGWSKVIEFERKKESGCLYTLVNNREYELTKIGKAEGDLVIEDEYRGKPVTSIAKGAFKGTGCTRLTSVVIGKYVSTIGELAFFNCTNMKSVTIPESVKSIGASAFQGCSSLTEVTLPKDIQIIQPSTFNYCKGLEKVNFNDGLLAIDEGGFANCDALKEVTIPDSVIILGVDAFAGNVGLEKVTIGKGVTQMYDSVFEGCESLAEVVFPEDGSLTFLGTRVFSKCKSLKEIKIPEGVTEIQNGLLRDCESLEKVELPDSLNLLGNNLLTNTKLYKTQAEAGNTYVYADQWLVGCPRLDVLEYFKPEEVREDVVGIAKGVFAFAPQLKEVEIPRSLKYVGSQAFYQCPKLNKVWVKEGNSLVELGTYAFQGCKMLTNVQLTNGIKEIESYCFMDCELLDNNTYNPTLLIPESVESVGTWAFKNTALWGKPDEYGFIYASNWLVGYDKEKFSSSNAELRKEGEGPNKEIYLDTVGISDFALQDCEMLQTLNGLGKVKHIGAAAFYNCKRLSSVTLNGSIKEIKPYTFFMCNSLYEVEMPRLLTSIGYAAFYRCGLGELDLSRCNNLTTIGGFAFYGNENMQAVTFGGELTEIADYTFYGCKGLPQITIPSTVTSIGTRAFSDCVKLMNVGFEEDSQLKTIGQSAFNGSGLLSVQLPDSMESIGTAAFYNCQYIVMADLGDGLQSIGNWAFTGCSRMEVLTLPESLQSIGDYAFRDCANLPSIVLKDTIQTIGKHAFFGCTNLTVYTNLEEIPITWNAMWNSSSAVVLFNTTTETGEDGETYVVSVKIEEEGILNGSRPIYVLDPELKEEVNVNPYSAKIPYRLGYTFKGWATSADSTEVVYTMDDLLDIPVGTTLYAVWEETSEDMKMEIVDSFVNAICAREGITEDASGELHEVLRERIKEWVDGGFEGPIEIDIDSILDDIFNSKLEDLLGGGSSSSEGADTPEPLVA